MITQQELRTNCTNKPHHEHARYCIRHQIPKVINSAPMNILTKINTHSLCGFSRYIKHTIIQSYEEICSIQKWLHLFLTLKIVCTPPNNSII